MVRYADDFVILCRSQAEAEQALAVIRQWCEAAGLLLHPTKTSIVDVRTGRFDFLGYHFQTTRRGQPDALAAEEEPGEAQGRPSGRKRNATNGRSLRYIIADLNRTLRGWFGYFQHSYHTTFTTVDGWVRRRLRSILRKRAGRTGRGRGTDHQRWPNAFFAEHGYYLPGSGPCGGVSIPLRVRPSTGEPDAGNPPVRFGGRGTESNRLSLGERGTRRKIFLDPPIMPGDNGG